MTNLSSPRQRRRARERTAALEAAKRMSAPPAKRCGIDNPLRPGVYVVAFTWPGKPKHPVPFDGATWGAWEGITPNGGWGDTWTEAA